MINFSDFHIDNIKAINGKRQYCLYRQNGFEGLGETQISLTDSDSRCLTKLNSHKIGYNVQTAVEGDNSLIVDFEVANTNDRGNMHTLASNCKAGLETEELTSIADKGYISATDIANCIAELPTE